MIQRSCGATKVKQQKISSLITACGCELLLKERNKQLVLSQKDNSALWSYCCKWHSVLFPHQMDGPEIPQACNYTFGGCTLAYFWQQCVYLQRQNKNKNKKHSPSYSAAKWLCDQPWKPKTCDCEGKEEPCKNLASPSDQEMPSKTCWMISSWVSYFSWGWCEKAGLVAQWEKQRPRSHASMCAHCTDSCTSCLQRGLFKSLVNTHPLYYY